MNIRRWAALGLLTFSPLVMAQSNLSLYGLLDIGVRRLPDLGQGSRTGVDDGSRSRIGLLGSENLGGGMRAFFHLEHSLRVDSGESRDPQRFFDDKAWVGLGHVRYGSVALGRLRSPVDEMTSGSRFDAFNGLGLGAAPGRSARAEEAWDNGVYYNSPSFKGLQFGFGLRAGEGETRNARGLHVEYSDGPFDAGLAYQVDGESLGSSSRSFGGGMSYAFERFTLSGTYVRSTDLGPLDTGSATTASLGASMPLGPGELRAAAAATDVDNLAGRHDARLDVDSTHLSIGYHYPLSKRTSVNAALVRRTRKTYFASGAVASDRKGHGAEVALRLMF